ncbi:MAG TPA: hypothetical protein VHU23_08335 [Rhizomicrobium sp.]|jgi:hypothetical protein|nr:hypothetical protein [Rhizomicrobium sp.]
MKSAILVGTLLSATSGAQAAISISPAATRNMSCSDGVCAPTASMAVLNVGDLESLLAIGEVTVTTTGSDVQAHEIKLEAMLTWSSASALSLDAQTSVFLKRPMEISGTGGLSLLTNDGGSGGVLSIEPPGHVTFADLSSSLSINGTSYILEDSVANLAAAIAAKPNGSYALANGYNAESDGNWPAAPIASFDGSFDALGNSIHNLSIKSGHKVSNTVGLFGLLKVNGTIAHLRLNHAEIKSGAAVTGGIVGKNRGNLFEDFADGKISGKHYVGGIAGYNEGIVENASSGGKVITNYQYGIAGGLVGVNSGEIGRSWSSAQSSGGLFAGGLVGIQYFQHFQRKEQPIEIVDCYATGTASAARGTGGFAGDSEGAPIMTSYSTGAAVGGASGGFLGEGGANGGLTEDLWDVTTSGTDRGIGDDTGNTGLVGETTTQLQSGLPAGFQHSIWTQDPDINNGLPYLVENPPIE